MGVYHISQILYLLGLPKIERISGKVYQETGMDAERRRLSNYDVEELGLGFVRFAGGVTLDIVEAWAIHLNPFEGSCIVGSEGGVRLSPFGFYCTSDDVEADVKLDLDAADWRWHQLKEAEGAYDSPQHHWIAAQQGRVELLPTDQLALQTMLISEGIYLSDVLGREGTAEEVLANSRSSAVQL
jgi:predicted dehydrogenase